MAPNGWRFMSYGYQELDWFAEIEIWADCTFRHKAGIWQNFSMTSLETMNTKLPINRLSFPLVTNTINSDIRFDSYGILKSVQGAEHFLDRLVIPANGQV
jgi:hypothetical protein